eukprot:m.208259 g.208259  ORF g.208259 m.208259 type:complete len:459 (-) comp17131_c0_seq1:1160-2536(-)
MCCGIRLLNKTQTSRVGFSLLGLNIPFRVLGRVGERNADKNCCRFKTTAMMVLEALQVLFIASVAASSPLNSPYEPLRHGWDTVSDMFFGHGSSSTVLSNTSLSFLSQNYKMVTFGNCYGKSNGTQEDGVLNAAAILKAANPTIRVLFYFKSWLASELAECSSANATWLAHPEWRLKDDYGNIIDPPYLDVSNHDAANFWLNHLVDLAQQRLPNGDQLLDGFFIDGTVNVNTSRFKNISQARYDGLIAAKAAIIARLQGEIASAGQFALTNGLDTMWAAEHFVAAGGAMIDHFAILQFVNSTTGELLPAAMEALLFEVAASPLLNNRTIQVKGWPGPIIKQPDMWPASWPTPQTPAQFRQQALLQFNNALSYFLIVAKDNFWWSYSWFWHMIDIEPFDPASTVPSGFFPELSCQLGEPKGPAKMVDRWLYVREFEYATVHVDLTKRADSNVTFHGSCP